jgi:hypothetical protein
MDFEPKLIFRKPAIADDLGRVAAWCRHIHPDTPEYTLFAVAFLIDEQAVMLEPRLAGCDVEFEEGPILQTAVTALKFLGYGTSLTRRSRCSPGTVVFEASLSAHENLGAIKGFLKADLDRFV